MRMQRSTFNCTFIIGLLFATLSCGQATSDGPVGDPIDGSFLGAAGKSDQLIPDENSGEARAILEVVNTYSLHSLVREVGLYWNAARNIVDHRNGEDDVRNSDDDMYLRSMAELDQVPYVGKVSMASLREYVHDAELIADHTIEYSDVVPTKIITRRGAAFQGTIAPDTPIRIRLDADIGDRILIWFRKAGDAKWNPRIRIVDRDTGEIISWSNPWGFTDARLPSSTEEASHGFEIDHESVDYDMLLDNTARIDGEYQVLLECLGGPCFGDAAAGTQVLDGDYADLEDEQLRAQMVARHEFTHTYLDYEAARRIMFEELDNENGSVECVYTGKRVETDTIPSNSVMNAEHTWPQSQGAVDGAARSDLHHLYPVDSIINSVRAAYPYCEVETVIREDGGSLYGADEDGDRCFEPRDEHKGNAARAMFYFAVVYQQELGDAEETVLRAWSDADPVDTAERRRNDGIEQIQGSRNPFVDDPDLQERIANF